MVDESSSIGCNGFKLIMNMVKDIVSRIDIGVHGAQVGQVYCFSVWARACMRVCACVRVLTLQLRRAIDGNQNMTQLLTSHQTIEYETQACFVFETE